MKNLKKIVFIATIIMAIFAFHKDSYAQSRVSYTLKAMTAAGVGKSTPDTTVNTDTTYLYLSDGTTSGVKAFNEYEDLVYSWAAVPSITGTTTSGTTIIAQGSMTGTFATVGDWITLIADLTQYNGGSSFSISGSTTLYNYFVLPRNQFKYVRLRMITAGTQTSVVTGKVSVLPHS